jgi:hypothetical protein
MLQIIDLNQYRSTGVRIFSGRTRGEAVRQELRLSKVEANDNSEFEVRVPTDIFQITSSFFLGLLGDTIRQLGAEVFRRKFRFTGKNIETVVAEGVEEALKRSSAIPR